MKTHDRRRFRREIKAKYGTHAAFAFDLKVHQSDLSRWINGWQTPPKKYWDAIQAALGVEVGLLFPETKKRAA